MNVHSETFEDAGEQNAEGLYDCFYSGTLFTFRDGQSGFVARQYADEPSEAHFLSGLAGRSRTMLSSIPYEDMLFREAVAYLVNTIGVSKVHTLLREEVNFQSI